MTAPEPTQEGCGLKVGGSRRLRVRTNTFRLFFILKNWPEGVNLSHGLMKFLSENSQKLTPDQLRRSQKGLNL